MTKGTTTVLDGSRPGSSACDRSNDDERPPRGKKTMGHAVFSLVRALACWTVRERHQRAHHGDIRDWGRSRASKMMASGGWTVCSAEGRSLRECLEPHLLSLVCESSQVSSAQIRLFDITQGGCSPRVPSNVRTIPTTISPLGCIALKRHLSQYRIVILAA